MLSRRSHVMTAGALVEFNFIVSVPNKIAMWERVE